jgi:hypothetical protein
VLVTFPSSDQQRTSIVFGHFDVFSQSPTLAFQHGGNAGERRDSAAFISTNPSRPPDVKYHHAIET